MCKELCDSQEDGASCQDCGCIICWDVEQGDDILRRAYATASGDLYCDRCGLAYDRAEEEDELQDRDYYPEDYP
jgi:hypothetical protein